MTTPIAPLDFSGVIPIEFSTQIIEEAVLQSAALQLGNLQPMGTSISEMPVPKTLPKAGWVSVAGGRKPYTDLALQTQTIKAEEVAAVTAIPDVYLEDSQINLWGWVRPRLAEAIAMAIDEAILFGINAPTSFPVGGVVGAAQGDVTGFDAVDMVNQAMGLVEAQGLNVTGHAADLTVKSVLRGQRDRNNALLLGETQVDDLTVPTLYGVPIAYSSFAVADPDFITGNWASLIIGVRQDIRYNMDPSAVIADDAGKVVISGWQDNVTPLKVWARFGCAIVKPVTVRQPAGAVPFAKANLSNPTPPANGTQTQAASKSSK
jgi:HK97 family phage major capsid protein